MNSNYEKDKALWENRQNFLEQLKNQTKAQLQDKIRSYEMTIETLQKRGNNDKEKQEMNQNQIIASMEGKHKMMVKELNENHQMVLAEVNEKVKGLEKENRQLQSRLQLE